MARRVVAMRGRPVHFLNSNGVVASAGVGAALVVVVDTRVLTVGRTVAGGGGAGRVFTGGRVATLGYVFGGRVAAAVVVGGRTGGRVGIGAGSP